MTEFDRKKIASLKAQGIDVQPHGACWLVQRGGYQIQLAALNLLTAGDIKLMLGTERPPLGRRPAW